MSPVHEFLINLGKIDLENTSICFVLSRIKKIILYRVVNNSSAGSYK
jgi:hypothetical protein